MSKLQKIDIVSNKVDAMISSIIDELNNDLTAICYDVIINHSILNSLDLSWKNFDVYPPENQDEENIEENRQYRKFRANLHGLLVTSNAFIDNFRMRLYVVTGTAFTSNNFRSTSKLDEIAEVFSDTGDGKLLALYREFQNISQMMEEIRQEYAYCAKSDVADFGLTNVVVEFDPDKEFELTRKEIRVSLLQYLEHVVRLFHLVFDLTAAVETQEQTLNITPLRQLHPIFEAGLKYARFELRQSAMVLNGSWQEFLTRIKDLAY